MPVIDHFDIRSQPRFQKRINLEKSLLLTFEFEFNIMICSLKPISVQQFAKTILLAFKIRGIQIYESLSSLALLANGEARTCDPQICSLMLYHLSYLTIQGVGKGKSCYIGGILKVSPPLHPPTKILITH